MINTKKYVSALAALALVLAMSATLVGCSSNASSSQASSSEASSSQASSQASSSEASSSQASSQASADLAGGSVYNAATMQEVASMPVAFLDRGKSDMVIYFAISEDTTKAAIIGLNLNTNEYVSYIGKCEQPEKDFVTVTDDATGKSVNYKVLEDNNNYARVDFSGDIGEVSCTACDIKELVNAMNTINKQGIPVDIKIGVESA